MNMDYEQLEALRNQLFILKERIQEASVKAHEVFLDVHEQLREVTNET